MQMKHKGGKPQSSDDRSFDALQLRADHLGEEPCASVGGWTISSRKTHGVSCVEERGADLRHRLDGHLSWGVFADTSQELEFKTKLLPYARLNLMLWSFVAAVCAFMLVSVACEIVVTDSTHVPSFSCLVFR